MAVSVATVKLVDGIGAGYRIRRLDRDRSSFLFQYSTCAGCVDPVVQVVHPVVQKR
jgi:hypothetical protein